MTSDQLAAILARASMARRNAHLVGCDKSQAEPPPRTANDGLTNSTLTGAGGQRGIVNRYFCAVIDPVPAPRQTRSDLWKKRPCVVRYRAYRDALKAAYAKLLKADTAPARAPDELACVFFMPVPISWSKSKKEKMIGQRHQQKPDIDNCMKATADALWDDDSHISSMHGIKYWGVEGSVIISMTWLES